MRKLIIITQLFVSTFVFGQYKEFTTFFALEDAAGRKDTIWYEANNNGTYGYDPSLGEVEVKQPIDTNLMFITVSGDDYLYKPLFLKDRIVNPSYTNYEVDFALIFINAKFPVKMTMNKAFLDNVDYIGYKLTNYIMSYCQWLFLYQDWYKAPGFECLLDDPIWINDVNEKKVEYFCPEHLIYDINIQGRGMQKKDAVLITTFSNGYCYQLNSEVIPSPTSQLFYPNPTRDYLRSGLLREKDCSYEVLDMSGRYLLKGRKISGEDIDVSSLDTGMYVLWVMNEQKMVYRQKFVKL